MRRVAYLGVVALSLAACSAVWGQDQEPGMGELPPPSPDLPIFAGQPATHPFEAISVKPGIPIELTNDGDDSLMLRLYIVEAR